MNVTEIAATGLKREYRISVPAESINRMIKDRLTQLGRRVRLPGFRPGKVPLTVLKQRYGKSVMGEVLEDAVGESSQQALRDQGLRPAGKPQIEITQYDDDKDLEYTLSIEILPDVDLVDFADLELERLSAPVTDDAVEEALQRLASAQTAYEAVGEPRAAQSDDQVLIDFAGSVDGQAREDMAAQDFPLTLGSNRFIPGFEEQLIGAEAGEHRTVEVTFPEGYGQAELAGKAAVFEVDVKEVREPAVPAIDDEMAKAVGLESLDGLRDAVRTQTDRRYQQASRQRLKRQLLDQLATRYDFEVPQGLVDTEFDGIWRQIEEALSSGPTEDEDLNRPEEELRAEYRGIAERRVRLGLVLSEVGRQNGIDVSQDEMNRAVQAEVARYPGREKEVVEFFRANPSAAESLRAPLLEEKVVDYILELARIADREVTPEELLADPDETRETAAPATTDDGTATPTEDTADTAKA